MTGRKNRASIGARIVGSIGGVAGAVMFGIAAASDAHDAKQEKRLRSSAFRGDDRGHQADLRSR
jgi:hypothetical protein